VSYLQIGAVCLTAPQSHCWENLEDWRRSRSIAPNHHVPRRHPGGSCICFARYDAILMAITQGHGWARVRCLPGWSADFRRLRSRRTTHPPLPKARPTPCRQIIDSKLLIFRRARYQVHPWDRSISSTARAHCQSRRRALRASSRAPSSPVRLRSPHAPGCSAGRRQVAPSRVNAIRARSMAPRNDRQADFVRRRTLPRRNTKIAPIGDGSPKPPKL